MAEIADPTVAIPIEVWAYAADEGLMEEARKLVAEEYNDPAPPLLPAPLLRAIAVATAARAMCMVRALDEAS
jgi:hypothetical protein